MASAPSAPGNGSAEPAEPALIAVVGPTASGKSAWALAIAERLDGEIIGADSRQMYRGLDIGTAKPNRAARERVLHHCVDHVDPRERYHLARFLQEARAALADIRRRGRQPLLVGGSGQYVWALLEGWSVPPVAPDPALREALASRAEREGAAALHAELAASDPEAATRIPPGNLRRVIRALEVQQASSRPISSWHTARDPIPALIVAPQIEPAALEERVAARVDSMFAAGLVAEVEQLLANGLRHDAPGLESIGYREVVHHLRGELSMAETIVAVKHATQRLAQRQRNWFRRDDPRIRWTPCLETAQALAGAASPA